VSHNLSTVLNINGTEKSLGDLRQHAEDTIESVCKEGIELAQAIDDDFVPGAIRGAMRVIIALVDELVGERENAA
jgi:hypothetical protein